MRARPSGFTLVELVVVLVLLAILAAVIAPRFTGRADFDELAAADVVKQSLRLAQTLAMTRTNVATSLSISGTNPVSIDVQTGGVSAPGFPRRLEQISVTATTVGFDRLGAPSATPTLTISGQGTPRRVCVAATTGYAYDY